MLTTLGRWCGRIMNSRSDAQGRWSWQKMLGKEGEIILIISAYRVSQKSLPGPMTAYTQQYHMLLDKDNTNPQPQTQFIKDLIPFIQQARKRQEQIIIALDANEEILPEDQPIPKHSILYLVQATGLQDVYTTQHDVMEDTSRKSNTKINHVLISLDLQVAVKHSGFLQWNQVMESDHRTGFVDFDELELFGENIEDKTHNASRPLSTDYPDLIDKYLQLLWTKIKARRLTHGIAKLQAIPAKGWREQHEKRYNRVDDKLTGIIKWAEKQCVPKSTHPSIWSTKLEAATRAIRYWNMRIMGYRKNTTNQELLYIKQTAGNVTDETNTLQEAQAERNQAWWHLRAI